MAGIDVDALLSDAHEALWAITKGQPGEQYTAWCRRLVEAYERLEQAYRTAQRELNPPARSAMHWALLDSEMAAHEKASEYRREANR